MGSEYNWREAMDWLVKNMVIEATMEEKRLIADDLSMSWESAKLSHSKLHRRLKEEYNNNKSLMINDQYKDTFFETQHWPEGYLHFLQKDRHFDYKLQFTLIWFLLSNGLAPWKMMRLFYILEDEPTQKQFNEVKSLLKLYLVQPTRYNSYKIWYGDETYKPKQLR